MPLKRACPSEEFTASKKHACTPSTLVFTVLDYVEHVVNNAPVGSLLQLRLVNRTFFAAVSRRVATKMAKEEITKECQNEYKESLVSFVRLPGLHDYTRRKMGKILIRSVHKTLGWGHWCTPETKQYGQVIIQRILESYGFATWVQNAYYLRAVEALTHLPNHCVIPTPEDEQFILDRRSDYLFTVIYSDKVKAKCTNLFNLCYEIFNSYVIYEE